MNSNNGGESGSSAPQEARASGVIMALIAVYLSWSSTYLAIKFASKASAAGHDGHTVLFLRLIAYAWLAAAGSSPAELPEWWWSAVIGLFLMLGGSAGVAYAPAAGLLRARALVIATTPLWTVLFATIWKHRPNWIEWLGLSIGFSGIVPVEPGRRSSGKSGQRRLLDAGRPVLGLRLRMEPASAASRGMMVGAAQMITGGAIVLIIGFAMGERVTAMPSLRSLAAVAYLGSWDRS